MTTDASDIGTRAMLSQILDDGKEHVVDYYLCILASVEKNYTASGKEALAIL